MLNATHFAAEDASDPALDKICADRHVRDEFYKMAPIALPLGMRPPFKTK